MRYVISISLSTMNYCALSDSQLGTHDCKDFQAMRSGKFLNCVADYREIFGFGVAAPCPSSKKTNLTRSEPERRKLSEAEKPADLARRNTMRGAIHPRLKMLHLRWKVVNVDEFYDDLVTPFHTGSRAHFMVSLCLCQERLSRPSEPGHHVAWILESIRSIKPSYPR
jgi:hypothetical protein